MADGSLDHQALVRYLVAALERTHTIITGRPASDPARALALGEAVALFNLADEFGAVTALRRELDARVGGDAYHALSEAMKRYYLAAAAPAAGPAGGAPPPRPHSPRPSRPPRPRPPAR